MEYEGESQEVLKPKYECLLFDLDDTIYPLSSGLAVEVRKNIQDYMLQNLGIKEEIVPELCFSLYKQYGTTMAGLKAIGYDFDPDDFHSYVHGRLPYTQLKPDPVLRSLLLSLPVQKVIFTNADKKHAARVLNRLGLEDCFEGIICFETLNPVKKTELIAENGKAKSERTTPAATAFDGKRLEMNKLNMVSGADPELPRCPVVVCKPFEEAFQQVFKIANINPQTTLFFDDSIKNLQAAKKMGLHTVWVGTSHRTDGVDHALESIHNIREALPELWEADDKAERMSCRRTVAVETTVRA